MGLKPYICSRYTACAVGFMPEILRFDSEQGGQSFFTSILSTLTLKPTWPVGWVLGAFYVGIKWLGHEANHTFPSAAEVKNELSNTSPPLCAFMACAVTTIKFDVCLTMHH